MRYNNPAADGIRAAKTDAAVAAALQREDRVTLTTIATRLGPEAFAHRYPDAAAYLVTEHCPDCGGVLDLQHDITVDEPYLSGYILRGGELPRRTRVAKTVAFCNGCEFAEERS